MIFTSFDKPAQGKNSAGSRLEALDMGVGGC